MTRWTGRLLSRSLLAVSALVTGLVVAEVGLRLFEVHPPFSDRPIYVDPQFVEITRGSHGNFYGRENSIPFIDYELVPGSLAFFKYDTAIPGQDYFDDHGRVPIHINAHGLRDTEFSLKPAPGTHRILCLGDSFTFGYGVLPEDSYPKQLEALLHNRYPEKKFEVINGGFAAGERVSNHVAYLAFKGHTFQPRTVILTVCLNDIGDVPMTLLEWTRVSVPGAPWCRLAWLLSDVLTNYQARRLAADPDACFKRSCGHGFEDLHWRRGLEAGQEICKAMGVHLLVAVYPMLEGLDGSYPWARVHEMVLNTCLKKGIDTIDLLPAFRGRHDRDLWVHPTDQHPSPAGHAIAARALAAALDRKGWLP